MSTSYKKENTSIPISNFQCREEVAIYIIQYYAFMCTQITDNKVNWWSAVMSLSEIKSLLQKAKPKKHTAVVM
jgi:hypothetical protein